MNSMQIKAKIKNIALSKNLDFNTVFRLYMYDRFLERLSESYYNNNFILKGGFYLSSLFGIENRSTMDIDTAIDKTTFNKSEIRKMIEEITSIDINDDAVLKLVNITRIKTEDQYGGYRATINIRIENINESFQLDITTGDSITPGAIKYKYLPILGETRINLWAYNIETQLAEKLETILSRAEANSRMRDYYDVYLIYKMNYTGINQEVLRQAIKETFSRRGYQNNIEATLIMIKNSLILQERWRKYSEKYNYAKGISYEDIIHCLTSLISTSVFNQ